MRTNKQKTCCSLAASRRQHCGLGARALANCKVAPPRHLLIDNFWYAVPLDDGGGDGGGSGGGSGGCASNNARTHFVFTAAAAASTSCTRAHFGFAAATAALSRLASCARALLARLLTFASNKRKLASERRPQRDDSDGGRFVNGERVVWL